MTSPLLDPPSVYLFGKPYGYVKVVAFFPDGKTIVTAGHQDGSGRLWDLRTGHEVGEPLLAHTGVILSIAVSKQGTEIVTGGADNKVFLWKSKGDTRTMRHEVLFSGPEHSFIHSVAFNSASSSMLVASSGSDGIINVWRLSPDSYSKPIQQISITKLPNAEISMVSELQFSPTDPNVLAVTSLDKAVRIFNAVTGHQISTLARPTTFIFALSWFPGGERLASAYEKTVRIWDPRTGEQIGRSFLGHSRAIKTVAISPNGKYIATGSDDHTVRIWNAVTGTQIATPKEHASSRAISIVKFSPDSQSILTVAEKDKEIYVWNLNHLEIEETLQSTRNVLEMHVKSSKEMRQDILDAMDSEFYNVRDIYEKDVSSLHAALNQKKENDKREFSQLKDTLETMEEAQVSEFDALKARLDILSSNHDTAFQDLRENLSVMAKKHEEDLNSLEEQQKIKSAEHEEKLDGLQGEVRDLKKSVDNLVAQIKKSFPPPR